MAPNRTRSTGRTRPVSRSASRAIAGGHVDIRLQRLTGGFVRHVGQLRLRGGHRLHPGSQSPDDREEADLPLVDQRVHRRLHRAPEARRAGEVELRRHDADDGVRHPVEPHRTAERLG